MKREELLHALSIIKPGLSNKEIVEQTTHFAFKDGEAFTYNDQISINCEFDVGFEGAVKAEEFFQIIDKLKEDEVDLKIKNGKLLIESGKTKASLSVETDISLPEIEIPEDWLPLPENFTDAMHFCSFSVGENINKFEFTCLNIIEDSIISCDNHRITKKELDAKIEVPFLLLGSSAKQLEKYKPIEYALSDNWIHFQNNEGVIFNCRTVEALYPDVDQLFEIEGEEIELPKELEEAVSKADILTSTNFEQDKFITLTLKKNELICRGEGQLGWLEESIPVKYKGDEVNLKVHPNHFVEILSHLKTVIIGENSLLFEGEDFKHCISLI